ncbi:MAG: ATP-binding cassette domain-containing protein [Planctomycetales bacterium]
MPGIMIGLEDVRKTYPGGVQAVRGVDLHVREGELLVLLGESGCGKTTLLKMINRLIEPTSGRILIGGRNNRETDPVQLRRGIGYVFQGIGLFPHLSVGDNVATVPRLLGWKPERVGEKVDRLLELVKLPPGEYRDRLPRQLSGGQRQRVGLARALAGEASIMLMDEPFGALDPLNRDRLQDEFRRIHDDLGLTTLMVTHDMTEALLLADRIGVMKSGGLLQADTPARMLDHPEHEYVENMLATPRRQAERLEALAAGDASQQTSDG